MQFCSRALTALAIATSFAPLSPSARISSAPVPTHPTRPEANVSYFSGDLRIGEAPSPATPAPIAGASDMTAADKRKLAVRRIREAVQRARQSDSACDDCPTRGIVAFVSYDSWRGVSDGDWQNNGIATGANFGTRLGRFSDLTGVGLQIGATPRRTIGPAVITVSEIRTTPKHKVFSPTASFARRPRLRMECRGGPGLDVQQQLRTV